MKSVRQPRVAFAFEGESKRRFLDRFDPGNLPPTICEWADVGTLHRGGWENFLGGWRPTMLVTSWETLAIPDGLTHADDLPLRYVCHVTGSVRQIVPRRHLRSEAVEAAISLDVHGHST